MILTLVKPIYWEIYQLKPRVLTTANSFPGLFGLVLRSLVVLYQFLDLLLPDLALLHQNLDLFQDLLFIFLCFGHSGLETLVVLLELSLLLYQGSDLGLQPGVEIAEGLDLESSFLQRGKQSSHETVTHKELNLTISNCSIFSSEFSFSPSDVGRTSLSRLDTFGLTFRDRCESLETSSSGSTPRPTDG